MRIALMTNNYKPFIGGVPISIERLKQALTAIGHQVTVFAPSYEEQQEEENVFRYASFSRKVLGGAVLPNPLDRRIEREFVKGRFDVIHVHHPMLIGRTAVYLSRKYHVPLAFTYHTRYEQYLGAYTGMDILKPLVPIWLNSFLKHCDMIFTPTKGLKEYLQSACRVSEQKLFVLPTGLKEESFFPKKEQVAAIRQKYHGRDRPFFLTVARLAPEKNIDFLIESMALVKERCPNPFSWVLIGDGPKRGDYEEKCRRLFPEGEVVFVGKVPNEEMPAWFQAADAFLFASQTETQGIVILEAFAGSTPVYALRATGVEDLVEEGRNGYLTPAVKEQYADRIQDYLKGRHNERALSRAAYATALEYREEAVAIQAVRLYNRIIAERNHCKIPKSEGQQKWRTTSITY